MAWVLPGIFAIGFGGIVAGVCGIIGCYSDEGDSKRGEKLLPVLMHFHESNLTASDVRVMNGMVLQQRDGDAELFRTQDFTAYGEFSKVVGAAGVAHCDFSVSILGDGAPRVGHGKLIAVDTRETSEADNDTITAFKELQRTAGTTSSHVMKLMDAISE